MNDRREQEHTASRYRDSDGKQEQEQTVTRYRRKQDKRGETVYVRRKSTSISGLLPIVGRRNKDRKHGDRGGKICGEAVLVPFPADFRERSAHDLPESYRVAVGDNDELLDRAYKRLEGLSADQLADVLKTFSARVLLENESRLLRATPRKLFHFLNRQYAAIGMVVLEATAV